ncbi:hypothetical protein D3C72_868170 [compost metagenome]
MLNLVDGVGALVDQGAALPANQSLQQCASARQGQLAVGVVEGKLDGVDLKAPVVSEGETYQAGPDSGTDVLSIDQDLVSGCEVASHTTARP